MQGVKPGYFRLAGVSIFCTEGADAPASKTTDRKNHFATGASLAQLRHVSTTPPSQSTMKTTSLAQLEALEHLSSYVVDFVEGPPVPKVSWESSLSQVQLSGQEIKRLEFVTWEQLEPAPLPVESSARVRVLDMVGTMSAASRRKEAFSRSSQTRMSSACLALGSSTVCFAVSM